MLKRSFLRNALALLGILSAPFIQAQGHSLFLYGTVRHYETKDSIPYPSVRIQEAREDALPWPIVTTARGRYDLELTEEKIYWIRYDAPGKVGKRIEVDMRGASLSQVEGGYGMNIEMTLFDSLPDVDFSILKEPIGRCRFDAGKNEFAWDLEYTMQRKAAIEKTVKDFNEAIRNRTSTEP